MGHAAIEAGVPNKQTPHHHH